MNEKEGIWIKYGCGSNSQDVRGYDENNMNIVHYNEKIDLELHGAKMLTDIEQKNLKGIPLEKEEISFLYALELGIKGFGYYANKRIDEIRARRDIKQDIATLLNCKRENVATSISDFDDNNIIVYYGNLEYHGERLLDTFKNLMVILGCASFDNIESAENLQSLTYVKGYLCLPKVKYSKGLENLQQVGGLECGSMIEATGFCNLISINGSAGLKKLRSAIGFENLKFIAGTADFRNLPSAIGFCNLESIGYKSRYQDDGPFKRGVRCDSLVSADGFDKLRVIYVCSNFKKMIDATAFGKCLEEVWDYVDFGSLSSTDGLENVNLVHRFNGSITNLADEIKNKGEDKYTKAYKA